MGFTTEKEACLALLLAAGGDLRRLKAAVKTHGSALVAINSPSLRARLRQGLSRPDNAIQVAQQLEQADSIGARWITPTDDDFPSLLEGHPLLCVRGTIPKGSSVAIVGTRQADEYGLAITHALAHALALSGVTVVSGAATGVDQAAHQAVLDAGGQTVAILGTGLLGSSSQNKNDFLDQIAESGAVVSEYLIGARGAQWTFPIRNILIAEMSQATIVVQAPGKSGALGTAKAAKAAGRPVFAVPGDIVHELSKGTNQLIADGNACLLSRPGELNSVLGIDGLQYAPWPSATRNQVLAKVSTGLGQSLTDAGRILDLLRSRGDLRSDQIEGQLSDLAAPIAELLLDLELKGQILRVAGDCYSLSKVG